MKQIDFRSQQKDNITNEIIDQFVDELHQLQFDLVTFEKEENFEEARTTQISINNLIEVTSQALFGWTGIELKQGLQKESDHVRTQIQENYNTIVRELQKANEK